MGCCYSNHKCDLVALHELRNGDHICINNCCNNINAIVVDIEKTLCVYLDKHSRYVTETYLSTLCKSKSKVYRYDYSNIHKMSEKDTIANSKFFAKRGKFSKCCLTSSYQFAYNCKVNKYASITVSTSALKHSTNNSTIKDLGITHDQESLLSGRRNSSLITPNAIDYHITGSINSDVDPNQTSMHSAGAMDGTVTLLMMKTQNDSPSNKESLEIQIDKMYDSHNLLLKKMKSMDDKIKNIQHNISSQDVEKHLQQNIALQSVSGIPQNQRNKLSESPITCIVDKSMTLTPIRCQTENPTTNNHLGVLVINDMDSSNVSGTQFTVVGSSMSMSETPIKTEENSK